MHGRLIFLVTSFAASVVAAPVPVSPESPVEVAEHLMVREASGEAISPVLDTIKREILERLDAIMERSVPGIDPTDRRDVVRGPIVERHFGKVPSGGNDKREPGSGSEGSADTNNKREPARGSDDSANANNKREPARGSDGSANVNNKREPARGSGDSADANNKREPARGSVGSADTYGKR